MSESRWSRLLSQRPWLLADGATGSNLFEMGLVSGDAPELWNIDHPDRIGTLHRRFIEAGADIVLTNSFGANAYRLKLHQAEARVAELNEAAARIARAEADAAGRDVLVAGSMGPTGEVLQPVGELSPEAAQAAFAAQAQALARGGVDLLWIETMSATAEVEAAVAGAATTGLPIVCTLSFDTHGRTMMGVGTGELAALGQRLRPMGLAGCGSNCGTGPSEVVASVMGLQRAGVADLLIIAKGNCGIPRYTDGAVRYDGTPELMAVYACMARDAGARIIGGCCGTTPAHLRAMREALESTGAHPPLTLDAVEAALGAVSPGARGQVEAGGASPAPARRSRRTGDDGR